MSGSDNFAVYVWKIPEFSLNSNQPGILYLYIIYIYICVCINYTFVLNVCLFQRNLCSPRP